MFRLWGLVWSFEAFGRGLCRTSVVMPVKEVYGQSEEKEACLATALHLQNLTFYMTDDMPYSEIMDNNCLHGSHVKTAGSAY